MLTQLHIVDFAIIEEVEVLPGPGLNVLTGETGAGKSIIVGAAALLRGGRASAEVIRSGRPEAVVEALFDLSDSPLAAEQLEAAGLPAMGDELLVRRVVSRNGRSRAYLNGSVCTLPVLEQTVGQLLDISGQHEHQLLSDRGTHLRTLDALAVTGDQLAAMGRSFARLREAARALAQTQMDDRQRSARIDFLRFQLSELDAAALRSGEDGELEAERSRLQRAADLQGAAVNGEEELYSGERSISERLARVERQLSALAPIDGRLGPLVRQLEEARTGVEDVAGSLRRYGAALDLDPAHLQQVEERLDLIHHLKRKHGASVDEILVRREEMGRELEGLVSIEQRLGTLEGELGEARREAARVAEDLSRSRHDAARELSLEVTKQLAVLRMAGARLVVEVKLRPPHEGDDAALIFETRRLGERGWDQVEFFISTNPGEEARPLRRIASGGELSRVMLALRRVLGRHDPVATSIYDEVDAGIGGAVADVVGRSLAEVARHRQVLCVTHLPQVAAHADLHFFVGKRRKGGRARTIVVPLAPESQVEEIARLLGGERVTDRTRANARELLDAAQRGR
jgi:DNA repair protein RecN (Recombination protein N)